MHHVIRINYKGSTEAHSIEQKATYREAIARFHNIAAADVGNSQVTYCMSLILDDYLNYAENQQPFVFALKDEDDEPRYPFEFIVAREFIKNGQLSTSIEYKNAEDAYKRYFNILAADLSDNDITYCCAMIIRPDGNIVERRQFTKE